MLDQIVMPAQFKIETKPEFLEKNDQIVLPTLFEDWLVMPFNQMRGQCCPGVPGTRAIVATQIIFQHTQGSGCQLPQFCNCTLLFPSLSWNGDQHKEPMIVDTSVQADNVRGRLKNHNGEKSHIYNFCDFASV